LGNCVSPGGCRGERVWYWLVLDWCLALGLRLQLRLLSLVLLFCSSSESLWSYRGAELE
jgi:hypothetical protein